MTSKLLAETQTKDPAAEQFGKPKRKLSKRRRISDADVFAEAKAARYRIEKGRATRVGGKFKRSAGETRAARFVSSLRLDFITSEVLKLHALQRRVHLSTLMCDILGVWAEQATDYHQAIFRECLPPGVRAAGVPERWVGYLASLGYRPLYGTDAEKDAPKGEVLPTFLGKPVSPEAPKIEPVDVEPVQGLVDPPLMARDSDTSNAYDAVAEMEADQRAEEAKVEEAKRKAPLGWGSAAQAYTMGMETGTKSVEQILQEGADEEVARLRQQAEDTRREYGIPVNQGGARSDG